MKTKTEDLLTAMSIAIKAQQMFIGGSVMYSCTALRVANHGEFNMFQIDALLQDYKEHAIATNQCVKTPWGEDLPEWWNHPDTSRWHGPRYSTLQSFTKKLESYYRSLPC
jgi:hypothetical protein